jgi:hypothetical protein
MYILQLKKDNQSLYFVPTTSEGYILGAILMELRLKNIIDIDNKKSKVILKNDSLTGIEYLDSTIQFIKNNSGKTIIDLYYTFFSSGLWLNTKTQMIKSLKLDSSDSKKRINNDLIHQSVESLRAELLEPGEVSESNKALILLLNTSNYDRNLSKYYFSEFEQEILESKMKEIKNQNDDLNLDLILIAKNFQGTPKRFFSEIFVAFNPKNLSLNRSLNLPMRYINYIVIAFTIIAVFSVILSILQFR